jgi:hypothetical protein
MAGNPNWKKGVSGNPGGRVRSKATWAAVLARVGREKDESGVPRKDRVARMLWDLAEAGHMDAIEALMDRMDGKPTQAIGNDDTGVFRVAHIAYADDPEPQPDPEDGAD